jgi:nucleoside 2-deoxyribosyltransferase
LKKAYFGIKFYEDHSNREEIESITAMLRGAGIQTVCMASDVEKWGTVKLSLQELMRMTFEEIELSDMVILEMSEKGVGLGIEAGYAVAKRKPLIVLIKEGCKISGTMEGIANEIIYYDKPENIVLNFVC